MKNNKIFWQGLFLLMFLSLTSAYAQVVKPLYDYGTREINLFQDQYNQDLIRLAEINLLKALREYPNCPAYDKGVILQADIDLKSGNKVAAEGRLTQFIKKRPNSPLVPFAELKRGYIAFELGHYNKAEKYFTYAENSAQEQFEQREDLIYYDIAHSALFWKGVALSQQGKHIDAVPVFTDCYKKYPDGIFADDALYALGRSSELNSQYYQAIDLYGQVVDNYRYSNSLVASSIRLANNFLTLRKPQEALVKLDRVEKNYDHIEEQDSIGKLYEKQLYMDEPRQNIIYLKAEAYNLMGNYSKALGYFQVVIQSYPESKIIDHAKLGAGWAHLNLGENDRAIAFYDEIIDNTDNDEQYIKSIALLYRVVALKRNGNIERARKELAGLSVQPTYPFLGQALLELGQIQYEAGDFVQARRTLERAQREASEARVRTRVHLLLGSTYMELGQWNDAIEQYNNAEQLAENSSPVFLPNKGWYISEARLKIGISMVRCHRSHEAINELLSFIGDFKDDDRFDEALFWLAEAYYRAGMLKKADETYKVMIEKYPESKRREEALYGRGWSNFRMKRFNTSSELFNQMIYEFPKSRFAIEVLTRQADGFYKIKNFKEAAHYYKRASRTAPGTAEGQYAAYQLGHALYKGRDYESAIVSLNDFLRTYPNSFYAPNAKYLIGWIEFRQGKYIEAINEFNQLIRDYPKSMHLARATYAIADAYFNTEQYETAIAQYKKVITDFPNTAFAPAAVKSIQQCLMALGREEDAIGILSEYIDTNPESPYVEDFSFKRAEMYYNNRKYDDAIQEYERFSNKFPQSSKNPEIMYWTAKSYFNLNEREKAINTYNELIKKYPESEYSTLAMLEIGLLHISTGELNEADSVLINLQTRYPKHTAAAQAGFERALISWAQGDTVKGIQIFRSVADSFPNIDYGDQSRYQIALYYRSVNKNDSARFEFEKLAKIDENPFLAAEAQYRIGELYLKDEMFEEAIAAFKVVRNNYSGIEDWYTLSLMALADAYQKTEEYELARQVYEDVIILHPDDDYGINAKAKLKEIEELEKNE